MSNKTTMLIPNIIDYALTHSNSACIWLTSSGIEGLRAFSRIITVLEDRHVDNVAALIAERTIKLPNGSSIRCISHVDYIRSLNNIAYLGFDNRLNCQDVSTIFPCVLDSPHQLITTSIFPTDKEVEWIHGSLA